VCEGLRNGWRRDLGAACWIDDMRVGRLLDLAGGRIAFQSRIHESCMVSVALQHYDDMEHE
jgi:hypothetical protein